MYFKSNGNIKFVYRYFNLFTCAHHWRTPSFNALMRINRPLFALPKPVGGTTIGRSKITPWSSRCKLCVYRSKIAFLLGILIQGSMQGNVILQVLYVC